MLWLATSIQGVTTDPCERLPDATPAVQHPGDIGRMFERLLRDYAHHSPQVLSRDPWLVMIDDFLSSSEVESFRQLCAGHYTQPPRASMTPCTYGTCSPAGHPVLGSAYANSSTIQSVEERIAKLLGAPIGNAEEWQFLEYDDPGQSCGAHHDQNALTDMPQGRRVYTFYVYLTTPAKGGGGTHFVDIGTTVEPRAGRAVLWPSLMDANLSLPELRSVHRGMPISRGGVKVAANLWVHEYEYRRLAAHGCSNLRLPGQFQTWEGTDPDNHHSAYLDARQRAGLEALPVGRYPRAPAVVDAEDHPALKRGQELYAAGRAAEAIAHLQSALDDAAGYSPRGRYLLGASHLAVGATAQAISHFLPAREEPHALVAAAAFGHAEPVRFLLREGFSPDAGAAEGGPSPLLVACSFGHLEIASLLVAAGADTSLGHPRMGTPMAAALRHGAPPSRMNELTALLVIAGATAGG